MLKKTFVFCLVVLFAAQLFAEGPFGRSLILSGQQQYFEVPQTIYTILSESDAVTVEVRFLAAAQCSYSLVNNWKGYSFDPATPLFGTFAGEGWLVDFNRSSWKIDGKVEMRYLDPLDSFAGTGGMRRIWAYAQPNEGRFGMSSGGGGIDPIFDSEWHHLAVVFKNWTQIIYLDGRRVVSDVYEKPASAIVESPLNFGGFSTFIDSTLDLSAYFNGNIDEVRIWNVARSDAQVSAALNDTLSPNTEGLVGYYRFEELEDLGVGGDGLANDVRDLSASGNHGNAWNGAQLTEASFPVKAADNYEIPVAYQLHQNYPNPFNPSTKIRFDLTKASPVNIRIYNVKGQLVATITNTRMEAGPHELEWMCNDLPSGLYLCHLESDGFSQTIKMVLQR